MHSAVGIPRLQAGEDVKRANPSFIWLTLKGDHEGPLNTPLIKSLTMTQDFEKSIVQGKAHWIASIVHEPASRGLVIWLTDNEVSFRPTRAIEFTDVQQLESCWIDRKEGCVEGLLGAHEKELSGLVRYLFVTDRREIELLTTHRAAIRALPDGGVPV